MAPCRSLLPGAYFVSKMIMALIFASLFFELAFLSSAFARGLGAFHGRNAGHKFVSACFLCWPGHRNSGNGQAGRPSAFHLLADVLPSGLWLPINMLPTFWARFARSGLPTMRQLR